MLVRFFEALWDSTFSVRPCWACTGLCSTNLTTSHKSYDVSLARTPHPPHQIQFFFLYHRPRDIWSGRPAFSSNPAGAVSPESSLDCYFWCYLLVVIHPWLSYPLSLAIISHLSVPYSELSPVLPWSLLSSIAIIDPEENLLLLLWLLTSSDFFWQITVKVPGLPELY